MSSLCLVGDEVAPSLWFLTILTSLILPLNYTSIFFIFSVENHQLLARFLPVGGGFFVGMFNSDKGGTFIVMGRLDQKEWRKGANEMRRKIQFHLRTIILPVSSWCN